jgi:hypothetical protein
VRPREFIRKVVRRGAGVVRWEQRLNAWETRRLDRRLGIETGGWIEPTSLTVPAGDAAAGIVYAGTQPRLARWWLTAVPPHPERFTFIDMGSGKGRVLVFAAQHGFRRALGVEFAQELHEVAVENARTLRDRGIVIEPLLGDAAAFEFPDGPLVVHFNNPFHEPIMERVLANLTATHERDPRPIVVLYQQMTVEHPAHRTRNLALLDRVPFLTGRTLAPPPGAIDRRMLAPFTVRVYESPELAGSL